MRSLALLSLPLASADIQVWPRPKHVTFSGPPVVLHHDFVLETAVKSAVLDHGHQRAKFSLTKGAVLPEADFKRVHVTVDTESELLGSATNYSYSLVVSSSGIRIHGGSVYGAMYGLETLSQLVGATGKLPHNQIIIEDSPDWEWRGVMIDTGRRFFPVPLVENLLDTMASVKLNVLHFHASDHCRFSVESKVVPNLTAALTGDYAGYYTQDDIKSLIAYAQKRGIRVVPEFDIPGHSRGWLPAKSAGVQFCTDDDHTSQMFNDPENKTRDVVAAVFKEMADLFTDEVFHIGADETSKTGVCSVQSTFDFEQEMLHIVEGYGKTVSGWEELYFDVHAGSTTAIINAWSRHTASEITATGRKAVESKSNHFYFTRPAPGGPAGWTTCWYDIGTGVPDSERSLLLGGEVSMWTDTYLETNQCGAFSGGAQSGWRFVPPEQG
jgi:hexosaminidase